MLWINYGYRYRKTFPTRDERKTPIVNVFNHTLRTSTLAMFQRASSARSYPADLGDTAYYHLRRDLLSPAVITSGRIYLSLSLVSGC